MAERMSSVNGIIDESSVILDPPRQIGQPPLVRVGFLALFLWASFSLFSPDPARAQALEWNQEAWGTVGTGEYAATAFFVAGTAASRYLFVPEDGLWTGGIIFDDEVRSALRLSAPEARNTAAALSDLLVLGLSSWPFVDAVGVWALGRDDLVAGQMTSINMLSVSMSMFLNNVTKLVSQRERPVCLGSREHYEGTCAGDERFRSFFSGHAMMGFTNAGLVCVHHANLPIYGGGAGDAIACATALTVATTISLLRVIADRHWTSDVLIGAIGGLLSGILLPTLLHYRAPSP